MTKANVVSIDEARAKVKQVQISEMMLYQSALKEMPQLRYKVRVPQLFPGVVPDYSTRRSHAARKNDPGQLGPYLALDSEAMAPFFAFANQFNCGIGFPGYAYLSELAQKAEYRGPVEVIAGEMTRKWIKFTTKSGGDKAEYIRKLEEACERFHVRDCFETLLKHDQYFGRAQLYVRIDGQTDDMTRQLPLVVDPKTIKKGSLLGFKTVEPIWTTPYTYNSLDPTEPDFFVPRAWYVMGKKTHSSRLITIVSRPVPDILKPAFNFGGMSISQLIEPYVIRWLSSVSAVNQLIRNYSILVMQTNMQATLQGSEGQGPFMRAKLFTQMRDNQGLFVLDKASENLLQVAVPLSGLSELQAQAQEHMAMPTHIPLVKLTGATPDGLNASSEGEIKVFYDYVASLQQSVMYDPLRTVINIVQLSEFGSIDEDVDFECEPLDALSGKELAEVRKADGEFGAALIDRGVIDAAEERQRIQRDPTSGYSNLSGPPPEPELPDPEDPNAGVPGGGRGGEAPADE